jgi:hypothetical protein
MSGKIVPGSGSNIYLKTAPASAANAIFEVFGTPTGGKLSGLVNAPYDPQDATIRFTACNAPALPLSMRSFAGHAKYATSPTISVTNLTTTTLTPNFSGGGGTKYYAAIGTTTGGTDSMAWTALADGTSALTLASPLTNGTTYYISGYASNTDKTRTLAVSNTTAYIAVTDPTITQASMSNTTFTIAVNAAPPSGTSNVYKLYTAADVLKATTYTTNTSGSFEVPTSNAQYYVTVQTKSDNTSSGIVKSSLRWCLAAPTAVSVAAFGAYNSTAIVSFTGNTTSSATGNSYTIGMLSGGFLYFKTSAATGDQFTASTVASASTYQSNTFTTLWVFAVGPNGETYKSSDIYFICQPVGGLTKTFTTPIGTTTLSLSLTSGSGGYGISETGASGSLPGYSCYVNGTAPLAENTSVSIYSGKRGSNGINSLTVGNYVTQALCGNGTQGGNGGKGMRSSGEFYYSEGGCSGGGGAASQIIAGPKLIVVGGGGGSGAGVGQSGEGGDAGTGSTSGGIGMQGNSYRGVLTDDGNGGGSMGGRGGGTFSSIGQYYAGGGRGDNGNCTASGTGKDGYIYYYTNITTTSGNGGDGVQDGGEASGAGGGGLGGGGSGSARNYNGSREGGGGGGGGSGHVWSGASLSYVRASQGDGLVFVMVS